MSETQTENVPVAGDTELPVEVRAKVDVEAIRALAAEHHIAMYSAKMVLKGKWELQYAVDMERPVFNHGVRWLLQVKNKRWVMGFWTFSKGEILGRVLKVRKYNILISTRSRLAYVEKIDTAFIYSLKIRRILPNYIRRDDSVRSLNQVPAYKPSDRQGVDASPVQTGKAVTLTLFNGDVMDGLVGWKTDFEFELKLDRYISVIVFRHSVFRAVSKEYHAFTQPAIRKPPRERDYQRVDVSEEQPFRVKRPNFGQGPPPRPKGGFGPR